jgi:hypothetical protein
MSAARNCELSAGLARLVAAPSATSMVISDTAIRWVVADDLDPLDRETLKAALVRQLDDTGVEVGADLVGGRIGGVPFSCLLTRASQPAHPSLGGRHLAVVR